MYKTIYASTRPVNPADLREGYEILLTGQGDDPSVVIGKVVVTPEAQLTEEVKAGLNAVINHLYSLFLTEFTPDTRSRQEAEGGMADERFWDVVQAVGWGREDYRVDRTRDMLKGLLAEEERDPFTRKLTAKEVALADALKKWAATNGESFRLSDDRFHDMIAHIVGLGRGSYEATLANPRLALERALAGDFVECFDYCVQWEEDEV